MSTGPGDHVAKKLGSRCRFHRDGGVCASVSVLQKRVVREKTSGPSQNLFITRPASC